MTVAEKLFELANEVREIAGNRKVGEELLEETEKELVSTLISMGYQHRAATIFNKD